MFQQKGFIFSLFFMLSLVLVSYVSCVIRMREVDRFHSLSWECQCILTSGNSASLHTIFLIAFPFIILFPFAFSLFKEKQIKMRDLYLSRVCAWKYYMAKVVVCFSGAFIILFVPLLINILMCYFTFDGRHMTLYGEPGYLTGSYFSALKNMPLSGLYLKERLLYYILCALFVSVLGGLFSIFAMALSTFIKKYMVFLLLPLYLVIEFLSRLEMGSLCMNMDEYISVSFISGRNIIFLLVVVAVLLGVASVCMIYDRKKEIL